MLPISFKFTALSGVTQAKALLYKAAMKPARKAPAPNWTNGQTSVTGADVEPPLTDPSVWQDRYALVTLTFEKPDGDRLEMNDAVVAVSRKKNIVTTQMVGMDGTVKEYINADDFQIKIAVGVQAVKEGLFVDEYPSEGIKQLREYFDLNEPINVYSTFFELFDIDRIVITDFSTTQATESNYQEVDISALSDSDYNVYSTEY